MNIKPGDAVTLLTEEEAMGLPSLFRVLAVSDGMATVQGTNTEPFQREVDKIVRHWRPAEDAPDASCDCCGALYLLMEDRDTVTVCGECWTKREAALAELERIRALLADEQRFADLLDDPLNRAEDSLLGGWGWSRKVVEIVARAVRAVLLGEGKSGK